MNGLLLTLVDQYQYAFHSLVLPLADQCPMGNRIAIDISGLHRDNLCYRCF